MPVIRLTDKVGRVAEKFIELLVVAPPVIKSDNIPDGNAGDTIDFQFSVLPNTGQGKLVWSSSDVPSSMTLNPDGSLVGTYPMSSAEGPTITIHVKVEDANGLTDEKAFLIRVLAPLAIPPFTLPEGKTNESYIMDPLIGAGGNPPYHWEVANLPEDLGLEFNTTNGQLTGTPNYVFGPTSLTFTLYDSNNDSISYGADLTVAEGLHIVGNSIADGMVNRTYSHTLQGAEGTPPYSFSIRNIPPGLTNNNELIYGNPDSSGNGTITVVMLDANNNQASKDLTYIIYPELVLTTTELPNAVIGHPYHTQLNVSGGKPDINGYYDWSITGAPEGWTIDQTTGILSGTTPTETTTIVIQVVVSDTFGATSSKTYALNIVQPIHIENLQKNVVLVINEENTTTLGNIVGGTPEYNIEIIGTSPSGMNASVLNESVVLSGTPTDVSVSVLTIQAVDLLGDTTTEDVNVIVVDGLYPITDLYDVIIYGGN